MKIPTVEELRKAGFKARVTHKRLTSQYSDPTPIQEIRNLFLDANQKVDNELLNCFLHPTGGETLVEIRTPEGVELVGKSVCSKSDPYNKKLGRALAVVRALNLKPETKFKVGDEVWALDWVDNKRKIRKKKIVEVSVYNEEKIKVSEDGNLDFQYEPCYVDETGNVSSNSDSFASKEELLESLES